MIYNVPPICKKPVTVFDGVVRGNGVVYQGNYQFTDDFKYQCASGETPKELVAGYYPGTGADCIGQFNGYVQLSGSLGTIGESGGDGNRYAPWGIYVNTPIQLTNKKKLTINAAHSYCNPGGGAVLTNDAPICVYLFSDIYSNMCNNNVRSVEVTSCPAFSDGIFDYDKEVIVPDLDEIVFDVSDLSGEYYVGFSIDRTKSSIVLHYYLNIGEIVAF